MPDYAVINADPVPAVGTEKPCRIYRGTHATEQDAIDAAAQIFGVPDQAHLFATLASNLARYTITRVMQYSSLAG